MPIYEYKCQACGHREEALQRMSDPLLVGCPTCHQPELVKLVSAASFRLKGGGWYETDFKNKPTKEDSKTDKNNNTKEVAKETSGSTEVVKDSATNSNTVKENATKASPVNSDKKKPQAND